MDFRISQLFRIRISRIRISSPVLPGLRRILNPSIYLEGIASRAVESIRPGFRGFYNLRRRLATISVLGLTAWLCVHVLFGANGMVVYRVKRAEVRSLQKEIDSLQKENGGYGRQIENLKSDPATIEKEAREQLHYARPGEIVYVSPAPASEDSPRTDDAQR
jgi:cell division protein FtsB